MATEDIISYKQLIQRREMVLNYALPEDKRQELQQEADLLEVRDVRAAIIAKPILSVHGISLEIELNAYVVHPCVVTLAPVPQTIHEKIFLRFIPEQSSKKLSTDEAEIYLALEGTNTSVYDDEVLVDEQIILAELVREHVLLTLDPLPRVANAAFKGHLVGDLTPDEQAHLQENLERVAAGEMPKSQNNPFSALKEMKKKLETEGCA